MKTTSNLEKFNDLSKKIDCSLKTQVCVALKVKEDGYKTFFLIPNVNKKIDASPQQWFITVFKNPHYNNTVLGRLRRIRLPDFSTGMHADELIL